MTRFSSRGSARPQLNLPATSAQASTPEPKAAIETRPAPSWVVGVLGRVSPTLAIRAQLNGTLGSLGLVTEMLCAGTTRPGPARLVSLLQTVVQNLKRSLEQGPETRTDRASARDSEISQLRGELATAFTDFTSAARTFGESALLTASEGSAGTAIESLLKETHQLGVALLGPDAADSKPLEFLSLDQRRRLCAAQGPEAASVALQNTQLAAHQRDLRFALVMAGPRASQQLMDTPFWDHWPVEAQMHSIQLLCRARDVAQQQAVLGFLRQRNFAGWVTNLDLLEVLAADPRKDHLVASLGRALDTLAKLVVTPTGQRSYRRALVRELRAEGGASQYAGVQALCDFIELRGLEELDYSDRSQLISYLTGDNQQLSRPALDQLVVKLPEIRGQYDQLHALQDLWQSQPARPFRPTVTPGIFLARSKVDCGPGLPTDDPDVGPATRFTMKVSAHEFFVVCPLQTPEASGASVELDELKKAIECLPTWAQLQLTTVSLIPHSKTMQKGWRVSMDCRTSDRHIRIFALPDARTLDSLAADLLHECAHALSFVHFGTISTTNAWLAWKSAGSLDRVFPSTYATEDVFEDFAETMVLAHLVEGTSDALELRSVLPYRMGMIDELLKKAKAEPAAPMLASEKHAG